MNPTNLDFLAIGDTVVDAFIKLKTAEVHQDTPEGQKTICMPFGDKVPFEEAVELAGVGNSANAAVSAARLGMHAGLLTYVGNDSHGQKSIESLKKDGVDTQYISSVSDKKTNYHYVLWYKDERTILINHEHYTYTLPEQLKTDSSKKPSWIYLSSLGENTLDFHKELGLFLQENPDIKLVFQPGTFQMKFGTEALVDIYKRTQIFFCNKEEAIRILKLNETEDHTIHTLLLKLHDLGPKLPVITDGPEGAYTFDIDIHALETTHIDEQTPVVHLSIYPDPLPPRERTGAGDAFASTFSVAIAQGKTIREALIWGSVNSMNVCQHIGAQQGLLTQAQIQEWIDKAPENWGPKKTV